MAFTRSLDHRTGLTADNVQQQGSGALDGLTGQQKIHTALEAVRCVRVQAVGARLAGQGDRIEKRSLKEQVTGGSAHTAVLAPHHTSYGQGALMVGNYQGIRTQGDVLAIQQDELLALFRHAHTDAAVDFRQVKGMHRLPLLEHDVVGHVDSGIDAADVGATQTLHHPRRSRLAQIDIANHPTDIASARLRREQLHGTHVIVHGGDRLNNHRIGGAAVDGADFTGQALQGQAVATVRRQADLDGGIIEMQVFADIAANRRLGSQLKQTAVIVADVQLTGRAQHAEGLDPTQFGFLDLEIFAQYRAHHGKGDFDTRTRVWRTAHDLTPFAAVTDLAHAKLVGTGVLLGTEDLPHHHATEI